MPEDCSFGEHGQKRPHGEGNTERFQKAFQARRWQVQRPWGMFRNNEAAGGEGGRKGEGKTTKSEIILG